MKQILQNLSNGETLLEEVPAPQVRPGQLLIRTAVSVVSAGTERMLLEFGKANFLDKARQQPDKVRQVLDKIRTDGLMPTLQAVRAKLDRPIPLGYSSVGRVVAVGAGVTGFAVGDRVVSNGNHAELVCVPENLCARVPERVTDEEAAFTVIGAIALQGIRLINPTLGERVVVTGLGLIGLLAVQLLRANGCQVLGIDRDAARCALARQFGAQVCDLSAGEDPVEAANRFSAGRGVDGVLITAATKSNEPMHQAALMSRKRGRIVLVGVTGLELSRADFYEKELSFQVSCSYGPGRYEPEYEQKGYDYPFGLVRWTEQRNFEAVLDLLADHHLDIAPLVSHRFALAEATRAYQVLGSEPSLGILLTYPQPDEPAAVGPRTVRLAAAPVRAAGGAPRVAVIGAGNYAAQVLIPALKATPARLVTLASAGGVSSVHAGRKYGFEQATTAPDEALASADVDTVVIATRHDTHARYAAAALAAGRHVFVEKPLAISREQLDAVRTAWERGATSAGGAALLMVGFNRRFAPQVVRMKQLIAARGEPPAFVMTVNAGAIPADHWTQDRAEGGGRIIGEACHFIDLLRFLAGTPLRRLSAVQMGEAAGVAVRDDKASLTLEFAGGAFGTIHYLANGHRSFPKERLEVFCGGSVLQLDNFRRLTGFGWPGFSRLNLRRQDKGQAACMAAFIQAVQQGGPAPIPPEELFEVAAATLDAAEQLAAG
jgi:predicted dehydrogenase/threonine dehydrogenase-like Zn-dependent dehydrogenase